MIDDFALIIACGLLAYVAWKSARLELNSNRIHFNRPTFRRVKRK